MSSLAMRTSGWVWEGHGLDPGVHPSIFGVGEGAEYFGLRKVHYMFHPNTALAMEKLRGMDEVVCDISKWTFVDTEGGGSRCQVDAGLERICAEARTVAQLSTRFTNITGAIHDDMKGLVEREGISAEAYAKVPTALKAVNDTLRLWAVVYTHELDWPGWVELMPHIDVVNLWVWRAEDLHTLDEGLDRCRRLFGRRPIIIGCYLRDYPTAAPVPMDALAYQWRRIARYLEEGKIDGYAILAAVLIDGHQQQARWVRDFIAEHS